MGEYSEHSNLQFSNFKVRCCSVPEMNKSYCFVALTIFIGLRNDLAARGVMGEAAALQVKMLKFQDAYEKLAMSHSAYLSLLNSSGRLSMRQ